MAKVTALTANTAPVLTDIVYLVDDPGGSALSQKITLQSLRRLLFPYGVAGGRLTLTTATPVTTADVTAAATLYYTPYISGQIGLYDGSAGWDVLDFTELSLDIAAYTASKPYDIWAYNNSGAVALDSTVWTNPTTRATALTYQNGILVKTGATTRRYLGTIYINASGGQTDDALLKRNVWNYYNRVLRRLFVQDENAHNYTTGTWRSWNGNAAIRWEFITGVLENPLDIGLTSQIETCYASIGIDVTNTASLPEITNYQNNAGIIRFSNRGLYYPAVGYHFVQITEYGLSGATQESAYLTGGVMG